MAKCSLVRKHVTKNIAYLRSEHMSLTWCYHFQCAVSHTAILCSVFIHCWCWNTHFLNKQWVTVCLFVWMWFITVTNRFTVLFVCCDVTCWYSLTDISTHQLLNPSQIVGNQLDHPFDNHGNYQTQIITHRTASNTSVSFFLKPLENILTIPKTPAASRTS
jgi:hypothetical protein